MRRRRLTVWLLVLLVVAQEARTADPHVGDTSTTTTEPTTTESMVGRGEKKFGDRCEDTKECGFRGSVCDSYKHSCQCRAEFPATNHIDKCGIEVDINGSCFFNEQCENKVLQTECKDGRCTCRFEMTPLQRDNNKIECFGTYVPPEPTQYVDPTMIGILVAMAAMFVIICVVLRLFSKARWRENRTIFNTPNPRLMNVSLLRDNKHPNAERRGSRGSNRAPSRQPSMASLRPQSPSASQGSRASLRGSRSSATSHSSRSPTKGPPPMTNNVHSNPDPNVTVEMQEPTA